MTSQVFFLCRVVAFPPLYVAQPFCVRHFCIFLLLHKPDVREGFLSVQEPIRYSEMRSISAPDFHIYLNIYFRYTLIWGQCPYPSLPNIPVKTTRVVIKFSRLIGTVLLDFCKNFRERTPCVRTVFCDRILAELPCNKNDHVFRFFFSAETDKQKIITSTQVSVCHEQFGCIQVFKTKQIAFSALFILDRNKILRFFFIWKDKFCKLSFRRYFQLNRDQCSEAGPVCFWASWIRIHNLFVRIQINKQKMKKTLDSTVCDFMTFYLRRLMYPLCLLFF